MSADATSQSQGRLLALSGLVVALLVWTYGDKLASDYRALEQRKRQLTSEPVKAGPAEMDQARLASERAKIRRGVIEQRLRVDHSEQLMRAVVLSELRAACADSGAKACSVRLSEASLRSEISAVGASSSNASGSAGGLESLGIGKARAVVSGTLAADELTQLLNLLQAQRTGTWRINGLTVRSNTFELDVERLFIAARQEAQVSK